MHLLSSILRSHPRIALGPKHWRGPLWHAALRFVSTSPLSDDVLRPYQRGCIEAIKESLGRHKRPAVSLPTGSGKTHVFSYLLEHVKPMYSDDVQRTKVLVIVNRKELLDQTLHRIRETHPHLNVLPISGKHEYTPAGDVFVSTYQTLTRGVRLALIDPEAFKLIIIDEAHHSVASSYIRILAHFNAVVPVPASDQSDAPIVLEDLTSSPPKTPVDRADRNTDPPDRRVHVVGFSATFWRNDTEFLRDVYDEIAFHENVNSMIDKGYLCPAKVTKVKVHNDELRPLADKLTGSLRAQDFFVHPSGLELVYNAWNANAAQKSTVIFGCNLAHINNLVMIFRNNGVDARCVHGTMSKASREDILARFAAGEFPVLANCQVLTEGTDIPRIDQIIIARGIGSTGMAMQMIGRGLRPYADKEFCNVIIFPNFTRFEANLDFLPQLESLLKETNELSDRKGSATVELDSEASPESLSTEVAAMDIDYGKLILETNHFEPALLASERYRPSHPLKSALAWLEWQKIYYLFPVAQAGYFSIRRQSGNGLWAANYVKRFNSRYIRSLPLISSSNLVDVLLAAEMHALARWGNSGVRPLSVNSSWLFEKPSAKQLNFLKGKNVNSMSVFNRGIAAGLLNLNSIGCKLTPELVQSVQTLIERFKNTNGAQIGNKSQKLEVPRAKSYKSYRSSRFSPPRHLQNLDGPLRGR